MATKTCTWVLIGNKYIYPDLYITVNILIYFLVILGEQGNSFCTLSKCTHFYVHCKWGEHYLCFPETWVSPYEANKDMVVLSH